MPASSNGSGKQGYTLPKLKLPTGEVYVFCMRCQRSCSKADKGAVVNYLQKPDPLKPKISFEQYQREMRDYIWAMTRETPLFDVEGGDIPGSCQFSVPALTKKRERDAEEFAALLKEKGWTEGNADTEQDLAFR